MVLIKTPRLSLRALFAADRDSLVTLDADPEVRRYLDMPEGRTPEAVEAWIEGIHRAYPPGSERGFWVAEEEGRFVGWFHLRPSRDTGECELGYRLRRDAWGRGIATEGSRALIEHAGERVIARALRENLASQAVMRKVGMVQVREFLYEGRLPSVEYATGP